MLLSQNVIFASFQSFQLESLSRLPCQPKMIEIFLDGFLNVHITYIFDVHKEAVVQSCSVKKDVLRNLAKFTGQHMSESYFK